MAKYDYLVVGAGLYGAVFAHEARKAGKSVLVIDRRPNIAGNVYTEDVEGIHVHKYGAHIFHTNDTEVWNYVQQFATFNRFTNSPVANYHGELYSLPFNMYTFNRMWGVVTPEEAAILSTVNLLTNKPIIYAANLSESDFADGEAHNPYLDAVERIAAEEHAAVLPICAEIEAEISGMEPDEKAIFLADMGLSESGLDRLIKECYALLGLISYLTAGVQEVRAWTIPRGTKAPQAAGKIHSDFERGFIRAEVVAYSDLMACGSMAAAKEKGLVRSEGKEYVMQDGDVVLFRFNV